MDGSSLAAAEVGNEAVETERTLWGLTPTDLHDRYWASRGIQVVRCGQPSQVVSGVELYLLTDPRTLTFFRPVRLVDRYYWSASQLMVVRIHDEFERGYVERIVVDDEGEFVRFDRQYARTDTRLARVAFTSDRAIADAWQATPTARTGTQTLRRMVPRAQRIVDRIQARVFNSDSLAEQNDFALQLSKVWSRPDVTVGRCKPRSNGIWVDESSQIAGDAMLDGPVWIGAGRQVLAGTSVLGPEILWDDSTHRPAVSDVRWNELEPTQSTYIHAVRHARGLSWRRRKTKRAFDIFFALIALVLTGPLFPLVALAIWFEDGGPIFFGQKRETLFGREFSCLKFRSMRKDAEQIKTILVRENMADGPQFFMRNDPRLTRVGRLIRRLNIDELPQFINVLRGDMSVVGPRPSPRKENQFCPPWREARLSVRAGITGLWQLMRTRRPGMDFQEWIRYDLEYVERMSLRTDLSIVWQTIVQGLRGKL